MSGSTSPVIITEWIKIACVIFVVGMVCSAPLYFYVVSLSKHDLLGKNSSWLSLSLLVLLHP